MPDVISVAHPRLRPVTVHQAATPPRTSPPRRCGPWCAWGRHL